MQKRDVVHNVILFHGYDFNYSPNELYFILPFHLPNEFIILNSKLNLRALNRE